MLQPSHLGENIQVFKESLRNAACEAEQADLIQRALACLETRIKGSTYAVKSPADVRHYLRLQLAPEQNEVFAVLFLSNQGRVLAFERLFTGTINTTAVYPRVILQRVLVHNAGAVIFVHNHRGLRAHRSGSSAH